MSVFGKLRYVAAAMLLVAGTMAAENVKDLPAHAAGYVNDFAGVLDEGSKQQLIDLCGELDHQAHAQVAVVTVHNLGGAAKEDFAADLFEKWGPGGKGSDRGVLLLFAIDDRKDFIEVGYGLQGILPDAKVGDMLRMQRPLMQQGQYGPAIVTDVQQLGNVIAADAGVTLTNPHVYHREAAQPQGLRASTVVRIVFFLLVLLLLFRRRGGRGGGMGGMGGGGFWSGILLGNLLGGGGRGWGGGGGGGFGGGGGNDDGGFGGFGGGSSDGGGAGGDW